MALTDDQKAMLRLLAQREEGYDDMAALMGLSVEEVRAKVKEALAEVEEEPEAGAPTEAQPAPPPPEPEPEASAPSDPAKVERPTQPATPPPPPSKPASRPPKLSLPKPRLPKDRGPAVGIAAGALVVVVLVVILVVGGSSGGSSSSGVTTAEGEQHLTAAEEKNLTQAILTPVDGGEGSGRALFGRYRKKVLLQVEAQGLEPSGKGKTYTVWLYRSPKLALQIGQVPVGSSGKIAAQFQIPAQLLAYVANGAFNQVDVSLTPTAEYQAAFQKAKREKRLPPHVGESVLRGKITGPAIR